MRFLSTKIGWRSTLTIWWMQCKVKDFRENTSNMYFTGIFGINLWPFGVSLNYLPCLVLLSCLCIFSSEDLGCKSCLFVLWCCWNLRGWGVWWLCPGIILECQMAGCTLPQRSFPNFVSLWEAAVDVWGWGGAVRRSTGKCCRDKLSPGKLARMMEELSYNERCSMCWNLGR